MSRDLIIARCECDSPMVRRRVLERSTFLGQVYTCLNLTHKPGDSHMHQALNVFISNQAGGLTHTHTHNSQDQHLYIFITAHVDQFSFRCCDGFNIMSLLRVCLVLLIFIAFEFQFRDLVKYKFTPYHLPLLTRDILLS